MTAVEKELAYLNKDSAILPFKHEILALVNKFEIINLPEQQSYLTINMINETFRRLCLQKSLTPLQGTDEEWEDRGNELFQNKRDKTIFKKNNEAYYTEAIVFRYIDTDKNTTEYYIGFSNTKDKKIYSHQYIKEFPFIPRQFVIDVILSNKKHQTSEIVDPKQLDEVMDYYKQL